MEFRKAEKQKAKLRLAITGTAGSGKTYGALLIAKGLGGRIVLLDTENGSGDLYAGVCDYDVGTIQAPYEVEKYIDGIKQAEKLGYNVIIIDSLSHAWNGEGGLLEQIDNIAAASRSGNTYTAWRLITPMHNKLIEAMLNSSCHIIATMRSKTDYVIVENDKGRKEPRKVGLAPIQRDGMDYEFGVVFDLNINHMATVSKDRTSLFDGKVFTLSEETGQTLKTWLESGVDLIERKKDLIERKKQFRDLWQRYLNVCNNVKEHAINAMKKITGDKPSSEFTDDDIEALVKDVERREYEFINTPDILDVEQNETTTEQSEGVNN